MLRKGTYRALIMITEGLTILDMLIDLALYGLMINRIECSRKDVRRY